MSVPYQLDGAHKTAFIIARRGERYREVLSYYWMDGHGRGFEFLDRCLDLLRIFSDPANRIALEQELTFLSDVEEDRDLRFSLEKGYHPLPFITTCAYLGFGCGPSAGDLSGKVHLGQGEISEEFEEDYPHDMVIDITDLSNVKYCFLPDRDVKATPADAAEYALDFATLQDNPVTPSSSLVRSLQGFATVSQDSLNQCWPTRKWQPYWKQAYWKHPSSEDATDVQQPSSSVQPLLQISVEAFLDELLARGKDADVDLLDGPLEVPNLRKALLAHCSRIPAKIGRTSSPVTVRILSALFEGKRVVDLSPYSGLTPRSARSLLQSLPDVKVLNLSGQLAASKHEISRTLSAIGHQLDELYILDPPVRAKDGDPKPFLQAIADQPFPIHRVILTSMLSRCLADHPWRMPSSPLKSFPVIQMFYKYSFDTTKGTIHEAWYLGDGLISPTRIVSGLLNIFRSDFGGYLSFFGTGSSYAHVFACSSPSLKDEGRSYEVNAFPAETFAHHKFMAADIPGRARDLTPDTWTIVLDDHRSDMNDAYEDFSAHFGFKVAMLRSKKFIPARQGQKIALEDVEVVDLETFLAMTSPGDEVHLRAALEETPTRIKGRLDSGVEEVRPRVPLDDIVKPMTKTEAVSIAEHIFSNIEANEYAREKDIERFRRGLEVGEQGGHLSSGKAVGSHASHLTEQ